ncbi:hypothetical protein OS493_016909 [Desmophyllum pertusum]|uniref:RRM domain-containing protein n=1 Tax=Desmophyllum pertusum TaxID=174260 RepID=A0A9X0CLW5_9CNID|nr:hypothetical protein OS493_016909 [Desmophyllum pertusum]
MVFKKTINIQIGRKLSDKSRDEILKAVLSCFTTFKVVAVQQGFEVIRVTFADEESARRVLQCTDIRICGLMCRIQGGGPAVTIAHPFESDDSFVSKVFAGYGEVKSIRKQKYLSNDAVYTGTRLVSLIMKHTPPRIVNINEILCRTWYKGQMSPVRGPLAISPAPVLLHGVARPLPGRSRQVLHSPPRMRRSLLRRILLGLNASDASQAPIDAQASDAPVPVSLQVQIDGSSTEADSPTRVVTVVHGAVEVSSDAPALILHRPQLVQRLLSLEVCPIHLWCGHLSFKW